MTMDDVLAVVGPILEQPLSDRSADDCEAWFGPYGTNRDKSPHLLWCTVVWWPGRGTVSLEAGRGKHASGSLETSPENLSLAARMVRDAMTALTP